MEVDSSNFTMSFEFNKKKKIPIDGLISINVQSMDSTDHRQGQGGQYLKIR